MRLVSRAAVLAALFALVSIANAQLVQKKAPTQADSVNLTGNQPLVYSQDAEEARNSNVKNATVSMDSREYSNDSLTGTLIGIGAEFVGQTVKNILSPNSAEADAVELERQRR